MESKKEGRAKNGNSGIIMQPGPSSLQILSQPGRTIMSVPELSSIQAQPQCRAPITITKMHHQPAVMITRNPDTIQVHPFKAETPHLQERVVDPSMCSLSSKGEHFVPHHAFLNTITCGNEVVSVCIPTHSVVL
jgi:hypothetical protein